MQSLDRLARLGRRAPTALAVALLGAQVGFVAVNRATDCCPEGYFSWAPNDYFYEYAITASVNGRQLTRAETGERYRVRPTGVWEDPIAQIATIIRRREEASGDTSRVVLRYRLNGHPETTWVVTDG